MGRVVWSCAPSRARRKSHATLSSTSSSSHGSKSDDTDDVAMIQGGRQAKARAPPLF